jgi:hypothetical protein
VAAEGRAFGACCAGKLRGPAWPTGRPARPAHGLLLRDGAGGPFTPIDVPGAPGTGATGINDAGTIVGVYTHPNTVPSQRRIGMLQMGRLA